MSRLIDADVFIEYLGLSAENSREENLGAIVTLEDFDAQPTAYDLDKVVERIREQDGVCTGCRRKDECNECSIGERIEIVKGGGVNE